MSDEQHETPQPVDRISLTELYQALPDYLAETAERFDVEAGLAELDAWIDEHEARAAQDEAAPGDTEPARTPDGLLPAPAEAHILQAARELSPELAAQWLHLQERHMALQERRLELEATALRHNLEQQALTMAHERELALRHAASVEEQQALSYELRVTGRHKLGQAIAVASTSLVWLIGFSLSILRGSGTTTLILGLGFITVVASYFAMVQIAIKAATGEGDYRRRRDAERVLRILLFREARLKRPDDRVDDRVI
ncbi:hypothetical protein AB0J80_13830 [Actinoplanes sp. NPDC049548]|uniref:hypothetical protein n=1 Tax=Actinoplanes sp. NPDC049548 TaxID=3155152 RepID=UPI0034397813